MIKNYLTPDFLVKNIEDIKIDFLFKNKIEGLIIDLDNTITFYNSRNISIEVKNWINEVIASGIKVVILSNNKAVRIEETIKDFPIDYVERAKKPFKKGYIQALKKLNKPKKKVMMIGDQIFTDTFGAKRSGLKIILVNPLPGKEYWFTYVSRFFERRFKANLIKDVTWLRWVWIRKET